MDNKFIILIAVSAGTAAAVYLLYQELQRQRRQNKLLLDQVKLMQDKFRKLEGLVYATNLERFGYDEDDEHYIELPNRVVLERSTQLSGNAPRSRRRSESSDESSSFTDEDEEEYSSDSEETDKSSSVEEQINIANPSTQPRTQPRTLQSQARFPETQGHPLYGYNKPVHPHQGRQTVIHHHPQHNTQNPFVSNPFGTVYGIHSNAVEVVRITTDAPQHSYNESPKIEELSEHEAEHETHEAEHEIHEAEHEAHDEAHETLEDDHDDEEVLNFDVDNNNQYSIEQTNSNEGEHIVGVTEDITEDVPENFEDTDNAQNECFDNNDNEHIEDADSHFEEDFKIITGGAKDVFDSRVKVSDNGDVDGNDTDSSKSTRVYKDTPINRKLNRVGQPIKK